MTELALHLDRVHKRFGNVHALCGADLRVPRSTIFALIGPNGAGKTTLVGLCCGYLRAHQGKVEIPSTTAKFVVKADKKILVAQYMVGQGANFGTSDPRLSPTPLESFNLSAAERRLCADALAQTRSIVKAAELLGITRHALKRRMVKHQITWPVTREDESV